MDSILILLCINFDASNYLKLKLIPLEQNKIIDVNTQKHLKHIRTLKDALDSAIEQVPKLISPILPKVGLAAVVGESDSGKSTFLRQLGMSIVLGEEKFLGHFDVASKYKRAIMISTEDNFFSVSPDLKKQFSKMGIAIQNKESLIENLILLFETEEISFDAKNLLTHLNIIINHYGGVDLVVIDAYTDIFTGETNSSTQTRAFLNQFNKLANQHECLVMFLHHTNKNSSKYAANKNSITGSQAFEAKMRTVLELRPNKKSVNLSDLYILKSNYMGNKEKKLSYELKFDEESLTFHFTGNRNSRNSSNDSVIKESESMKEAISLHKNGLSYREIEEKLQQMNLKGKKSTIAKWIKKYKIMKL